MTIRRQYSLPNCTLILEGLSDGTGAAGSQTEARPLMTILVNAECYLVGQGQPLRGGRDFFESLVQAVNRYAQEFLSHIPHPKRQGPGLVELEHLKDKPLHRLRVLTDAAVSAGQGASAAGEAQTVAQVDLTTVQLFDLVDAIDQFLADRQTLPDLHVPLQPVPRRYRKAEQPLAKRAAPAALGMTSLAVAAIAFFFVPIPEVREPRPTLSQPNASETSSPPPNEEPQADASPAASPDASPPSAAELEAVLSSAPEIEDPTELGFLERNLYKELNQAWDDRGLAENLEYQVVVGKDGAVIGYKPVGDTTLDAAAQTPLPDLLYIPTTGSVATQEAIAQFRVVFTTGGVLEISPWRGRTGEAGFGPEITDSDQIEALSQQVYAEVRKLWDGVPSYEADLVYRVAATEAGVIADYEPLNQAAWDYVEETPLEAMLKPEAAGIGSEDAGLVPQEPLAQLRVVFKPSGILEVSPFPSAE